MRDRAREAATGPYRQQWPAVLEGLRRLAQLRTQPVPADLGTWAADLADEGGWAVPLLGTPLTAPPYPALLWNGARSARAGLGTAERLVLVALVSGGPTLEAAGLCRAVAAGLAADAAFGALEAPDPSSASAAAAADPIAGLTTPAVAAAVCAALAAGIDPARQDAVIDLAGSLMLIRPPDDAGSLEAELSAGHAAAVGWLATVLRDAGIRAPAQALELTIDAVGPCGAARVADQPPPDVQRAGHPVSAEPGRYRDPDLVGNSALWALLR